MVFGNRSAKRSEFRHVTTHDRDLLIKTALLGTARAPLPENLIRQAEAWGLDPAGEPARLALDLLAMMRLQGNAGVVFEKIPAVEPAPLPDGEPAPAALSPLLDRVLTGDQGLVLDELLGLCLLHKVRLPAAFLPLLLDRCVQDADLFDQVRPLLGELAEWLAAQNPYWQDLFDQGERVWEQGRFAARLRWLRALRARQPLVALALLEKGWKGEKPEHRLRLLDALQVRLSVLDEDFLEQALTREKRRDIRQKALELLLILPGSHQRTRWTAFFRERLGAILGQSDPEVFLLRQLPEIDEQPIVSLVALLPENELKNWRMAAASFLLSCLPPADLLDLPPGGDPFSVLRSIAGKTSFKALFRNLLYGALVHGDASWRAAFLQFREHHHESPLWDAEALLTLLRALPPDDRAQQLVRLLGRKDVPLSPGAPLVRVLRDFAYPWPFALLEAFFNQLEQLPAPAPHHREMLERAACYCRPVDAEALRARLDPARWPGWRYELHRFFDVIQFRRRLHAVFEK